MESRNFLYEKKKFDFVVVGAGLAGISAAVSAARLGKKVALVTDRPILGGSASSEIRVGPGGADAPPWNRYSRESGIIEEVYNTMHYKASLSGKWRWMYFDQIYFDIVMKEKNITCFLNTTINKVNMSENKIVSIEGIQLRSERIYDFEAKVFSDCSGDGTVGFLAGATYRIGREAKSEFNERFAPEVSDLRTMGASLLFTSVQTTHPVKYEKPDWAMDIKELPSYCRIHRSMNRQPDGSFYGFWWVEAGGLVDSIHDDANVDLELRKLVYGIWDYIKNSGDFSNVATHDLNWIGYLAGKRESRRLIGPYIMNANDLYEQKTFEDKIAYTGWSIDIHPPEGYLHPEMGCTHEYLNGITDVPYRCLYSENIENLFFAGRNISVSHEALGSVRLISTTAVMGQAVGSAASICVDKNINPSDIYENHMSELQQSLLKQDVTLLDIPLVDKNDLTQNAKVSVSSTQIAQLDTPEHFRYINTNYGLIIPVLNKLNKVMLYLGSEKETEVTAEVYNSDGVVQNYRINKCIASKTFNVKNEGWVEIQIDDKDSLTDKVFVFIRKNPDAKIFFQKDKLTGFLPIISEQDGIYGFETRFSNLSGSGGSINGTGELLSHVNLTPCFKTEPVQNAYTSENIKNGYTRPFGNPNLWMSKKIENRKSENVSFSFDKEKSIKSIEIVFNSDLNHSRLAPIINKVNDEMVKSFDVVFKDNNNNVVNIVSEENNYQRLWSKNVDLSGIAEVSINIYESWGINRAEIFDVRIYN